jgi:5'-nucleotidase
MERRKFLQLIGMGAAGMVIRPELFAGVDADWLAYNDLIKLSILHTNDMHSRIESFPMSDPKYPGQGGMAMRSALIQSIREKEGELLLLDAGDVFQGTPYFNMFGGEPEFKFMSMMGYDACTIGNHDLDNGIEGLKRMLPYANFPFINANYNLSDTSLFNDIIPSLTFNKNKIKIGVTGVGVDFEGLVSPANHAGATYMDPVEVVNRESRRLKYDEGCNLVIVLSHLGYSYKNNQISDLVLASSTENVDIIIGGHTHTFLEKPTAVHNRRGQLVQVAQVGWAGLNLGKIDCYFTRDGKLKGLNGAMLEISKKQ